MGIRRIDRQLEAKLESVGPSTLSGGSGKLERTWYKDGTHRLQIKLRKLGGSSSTAVVSVHDVEIARVALDRGSGRHDFETKEPERLPPLAEGQVIRVHVDDNLVLEGELYVD